MLLLNMLVSALRSQHYRENELKRHEGVPVLQF